MDLQKIEKILNKMDRMLDKMSPADTDSMFDRILAALEDLETRVTKLEGGQFDWGAWATVCEYRENSSDCIYSEDPENMTPCRKDICPLTRGKKL